MKATEYLDMFLEGAYIAATTERDAMDIAKHYVENERNRIVKKLPGDFVIDSITVERVEVEAESRGSMVGQMKTGYVSGSANGVILGHQGASPDKIKVPFHIDIRGGLPKGIDVDWKYKFSDAKKVSESFKGILKRAKYFEVTYQDGRSGAEGTMTVQADTSQDAMKRVYAKTNGKVIRAVPVSEPEQY
jgi:hypothetical protein